MEADSRNVSDIRSLYLISDENRLCPTTKTGQGEQMNSLVVTAHRATPDAAPAACCERN